MPRFIVISTAVRRQTTLDSTASDINVTCECHECHLQVTRVSPPCDTDVTYLCATASHPITNEID